MSSLRCCKGLACVATTMAFVSLGRGTLAQDEPPFGLTERVPWTTSRVIGSPDPPLPYTVERAFTKIDWKRPVYAKAEPGTNWLCVVLQGGEADSPSRVLRVLDDPVVQVVNHAQGHAQCTGKSTDTRSTGVSACQWRA